MSTILLTGATGNVTSAVIRSLQGSPSLIGLVRDPAKAKDLAPRASSCVPAICRSSAPSEGRSRAVDVAWLAHAARAECADPGVECALAARLGGVKHVVRMSAVGGRARCAEPQQPSARPLGRGDRRMRPLVHRREAALLMQNLMMAAQSVAEQGTIYFALGDAKLPMVDVRDIGASVAAILGTLRRTQARRTR